MATLKTFDIFNGQIHMKSCKSQQLFSSIKVLNLTIAADFPMAALVRSLLYFCFIKFAFV